MTNAISIGSNQPTPRSAPAQASTKAPGASAFASLIDLGAGDGPGRQTGALVSALPANAQVSSNVEEQPQSQAVAGVLSDLMTVLEGMNEDLEGDLGLAPQDIEELQALLGQLDGLMQAGAQLPLPEGLSDDALATLANSLGLSLADAGKLETAPLDALSALATKIGGALREDQPQLAAQLTQAVKALDGHSTAIETALSGGELDADMRRYLLESENRPNASAAITNAGADADKLQAAAQQASAIADAQARSESSKSAYNAAKSEGASERLAARADASVSPSRPSGENPGDGGKGAGTGTGAGQPATPTQASASAPQPDADLPDGLTFTVNQQSSTPVPGAITRPEAAAYQRPDAQINLPHIAVEISRHIQKGTSRFEIRLNPSELGRIDVRMEMDQSGNVIARLAVERSETLDLLQRDQRALEKALSDAGLDSGKTQLEFSLQQDRGQSASDERNGWQADEASLPEHLSADTATQFRQDIYRGYARLDAVNLWV